MNSVAEILRTLPTLTNEQLREVEAALINAYRERKVGIVYDDAYGVLTESDMMAIAGTAFEAIDGAKHEKGG